MWKAVSNAFRDVLRYITDRPHMWLRALHCWGEAANYFELGIERMLYSLKVPFLPRPTPTSIIRKDIYQHTKH